MGNRQGTFDDDAIRDSLTKARESLGIAGDTEQARQAERLAYLRGLRKQNLARTPAPAVPATPARRNIPEAVIRGFDVEVGERVMRWDWIENRRGDRLEEGCRDGGGFLAYHLAVGLYARITA